MSISLPLHKPLTVTSSLAASIPYRYCHPFYYYTYISLFTQTYQSYHPNNDDSMTTITNHNVVIFVVINDYY